MSDIVDEFLLGEDLVLCDPSGPAGIIQPEGRMIFCGVCIPLKLVKPPIIKRITVADCCEVPPLEEFIVNAYVDRDEHVIDEEEHQLLIEMHPNFPEGYGCLLAPTVVNAVPVCISNPNSKHIVIRQDSVVGQVEPVKMEHAIAKHENPSEIGKDSAARHVTLRERKLNQRVKCICPDTKLSSTDSLLQERQTFRSLFLHCLSTKRASMSKVQRVKVRWSVHRFTVFC